LWLEVAVLPKQALLLLRLLRLLAAMLVTWLWLLVLALRLWWLLLEALHLLRVPLLLLPCWLLVVVPMMLRLFQERRLA
jgi:hypothetical protein